MTKFIMCTGKGAITGVIAMNKRSEAEQGLLFEHLTIQKREDGWCVYLNDGTVVGPFSSKARAENWKDQYESTMTRR